MKKITKLLLVSSIFLFIFGCKKKTTIEKTTINPTTKATITTENKTTTNSTTEAKYSVSVDNNISGISVNGIGKYKKNDTVTLTIDGMKYGYYITWLINGNVVEVGSKYSFIMDSSDVNITLSLIKYDFIYLKTDNFFYFGTYPQTELKNNTIKEELDSTNAFSTDSWTNYEYYSRGNVESYMYYKDVDVNGDGFFDYRGVYLTKYRPYDAKSRSAEDFSESNHSYQDENGYGLNKIYWFMYEPIKWDILKDEDGKALITTSLGVDVIDFYNDNITSIITHNGKDGYVNNYELSNIRKWLNNDFYNSTFNELQKDLITLTDIDNSINSTLYGNTSLYEGEKEVTPYLANDTEDNIFILSVKELYDYFYIEGSSTSGARILTTDYANANGANICTLGKRYYLRTPYNNENYVFYVDDIGAVTYTTSSNAQVVTKTDTLVRPCLWIDYSDSEATLNISKNNDGGTISLSGEYKLPIGYDYRLTATINTGYTFNGWFVNGELATTELVYEFKVTTDANIEARYTIHSNQLVIDIHNPDTNAVTEVVNSFDYDELVKVNSIVREKVGYNRVLYDEDGNKVEFKDFNMPDYSLVYDLYYEIITYKITYYLNGGTNNSNNITEYTIKTPETFFLDATKEGYTFKGWYLNDVVKVDRIYEQSYGNRDLYARFELIEYDIEYILDGGTNDSNNPNKYSIESNITLENPTKEGYTFMGWYYNDELITRIDNKNTCNMTITAHWTYYTLSTSRNNMLAGTITFYNNKKITKGTDVLLKVTTNPGFVFDGWYNGETRITAEEEYSFKMPNEDLDYTAKWVPQKYEITLVNHTVTIMIDGVTSGEEYECGSLITLTPITNLLPGQTIRWSRNDGIVYYGDCYSFYVPAGNITITASLTSKPYTRSDKKIYFGYYPQTLERDEEYTLYLNSLVGTPKDPKDGYSWIDYGYYINDVASSYMWYIDLDTNRDGRFDYRGVYFTNYRPSNIAFESNEDKSYQDDNGYSINTIYWFKYEIIEWNILEEESGKAMLIANLILDAQDFYPATLHLSNEEFFHYTPTPFEHNGGTGYFNDYALSNIRKWLNDNFYNTVFNSVEKEIIETTIVDNSGSTVDAYSGYEDKYACSDTEDKVFLLSYLDANTYYESNSERIASSSDYARIQGVSPEPSWRLRSPYCSMAYNHDSNQTSLVYYSGSFISYNIGFIGGVRPVIWITL